MQRAKAGFLIVVLLTAALAGYRFFAAGQDNASSTASHPVARTVAAVVQPVTFEAERTRLEAVGTSRAIKSVEIYSLVSGEVTGVPFSAGDTVNRGDLLLTLDQRKEQLAYDLATIRFKDAARNLRRLKALMNTGYVAPAEIDAARKMYEETQIELKRAKVALEDRTIRAPFSGHVGHTDVDVGDRIDPSTMITTLDDRSVLLVRFEVPEAFVGVLEAGTPVSVSSWASTHEVSEGRIVDIGSRIDPVSRTFVVRAQVPNADDRLRPGMSFRVRLDIVGRVYPTVPEVAVQWGNAGSYIWIVEQGHAQRVPARVVQRREGVVLVDAALASDSLVVVEGIQRMREGIKIDARRVEDRTDHPPAAEPREGARV